MDLTFENNQPLEPQRKIIQIPRRFFGPVGPAEASAIVEDCLHDNAIRDTLIRLATGEQEPREAIFEIQLLLEAAEERQKNADREERRGGDSA